MSKNDSPQSGIRFTNIENSIDWEKQLGWFFLYQEIKLIFYFW